MLELGISFALEPGSIEQGSVLGRFIRHFAWTTLLGNGPSFGGIDLVGCKRYGLGGFVLSKGSEVARGDWPSESLDIRASTTWRELRAIALVLDSLSNELKSRSCIHLSDNKAAVHIVKYGRRKPHLQQEALQNHKACRRCNNKLYPEWVHREENELADYYSKLQDEDDW